MERILNNKIIIIGWLLFILCLFLPAAIEHNNPTYGYTLGMYAVDEIPDIFSSLDKWPIVSISGISNIMALLSYLL